MTPNATTRSPGSRRHGWPVPPQVALGAWFAAWVVGSLLAATVLAVGGQSSTSDAPLALIAFTMAAGWLAYLVALLTVSNRSGSGHLITDYAVAPSARDLAWLPVGVACQLLLVPAVYYPLRPIWPTTFGDDALQKNASSLADAATNPVGIALLVLLVVVAAPLIEELVYRGLIQHSFVAAWGRAIGVAAAALLFTFIHLRPVEYPGLLAFSLVLGLVALRSERLGPAIAMHVGFNAAGLLGALT